TNSRTSPVDDNGRSTQGGHGVMGLVARELRRNSDDSATDHTFTRILALVFRADAGPMVDYGVDCCAMGRGSLGHDSDGPVQGAEGVFDLCSEFDAVGADSVCARRNRISSGGGDRERHHFQAGGPRWLLLGMDYRA